MSDTKWRLVLCWGTVLTFLLMPLFIFLLAFFNRDYEANIREFKFLGKFFESNHRPWSSGWSGLRKTLRTNSSKQRRTGTGTANLLPRKKKNEHDPDHHPGPGLAGMFTDLGLVQ